MNDMRVRLLVATVWKGGKGNDPDHPHQMWLKAAREDVAANAYAFAAARAGLPEGVVEKVLMFCDNAQYHFISRLIFRKGINDDGTVDYVDTVDEAFAAAQKDQEAYLVELQKAK